MCAPVRPGFNEGDRRGRSRFVLPGGVRGQWPKHQDDGDDDSEYRGYTSRRTHV